uniref:Uncharacterized protein n=1 Tax=Parascaris equorum TaxID=6256 RepID=A0A914RQY7_PAREQ
MARKLAANRGSFGTTTSNPPRSWEANKIGDFSKVFYAASSVISSIFCCARFIRCFGMCLKYTKKNLELI